MIILDLKRPIQRAALSLPVPKRVQLSPLRPRRIELAPRRGLAGPDLQLRRQAAVVSTSPAPVKVGKAGIASLAAIALAIPLVGGGFAYKAYVKEAALERIAAAGADASAHGLLVAIATGKGELIEAYRKLNIEVATTPRVIEAAVESGSPDLLKTVLGAGAKLDNEPNAGTLIAKAINADHGELIQILAGLGLDVNASLGDGRSPLVYAANESKWKAVQKLIELNAKLDVPSLGGNSIAHHMVPSNDPALFTTIAAKGADLNKENDRGETPLLFAVDKDAREIVPMLLKAGGDPLKASSTQVSAFGLAMSKQDDVVVAMFLEARPTLLEAVNAGKAGHYLVEKGMAKSAGLIIGKSLDPNSVFEDGLTPLALSATASQPAMMKVLLEKGADPNLPVIIGNTTGITPLMLAAAGGNVEAVDALLKAGAKPDALASNGATALDIAMREGKAEIAARLESQRLTQTPTRGL